VILSNLKSNIHYVRKWKEWSTKHIYY